MVGSVEEGFSTVPGPRTLARAFAVLDCFTRETSRWRTTPLANECGLPVPTVYRMLTVFEAFGYVARDPDSREYRLGPAAAGLTRRTLVPAALAPALPVLRSLGQVTGERVVLARVQEGQGHRLELTVGQPGGPDAPPRSDPGLSERTAPLDTGAPCKVLLAHLPEERIEALVEWNHPASEALALRSELAAIRRRGWALSREDTAAERWAIAVPVFDRAGRASFSLGVSAPRARLETSLARRYLAALGGAALTLAQRLAGSPAGETAKGAPA